MLKNIIYIILVASLLSSCNNQLDEINKNPNATETPLAAYLLTGNLKQGADLYWGSESNFNSSLLFVQQWAKFNMQSLTGMMWQIPVLPRYGIPDIRP